MESGVGIPVVSIAKYWKIDEVIINTKTTSCEMVFGGSGLVRSSDCHPYLKYSRLENFVKCG